VQTGNPTKFKFEITVGGLTEYEIFDGQNYYEYIPSENIAYEVSAATMAQYSSDTAGSSSIVQYTPVNIGSKTINGYACTGWQYTDSTGVTWTMWISTQYGLPVEIDSAGTTIDYTNYSFTGISASTFELPAGVTATPLP
jgi:hypothetical protein